MLNKILTSPKLSETLRKLRDPNFTPESSEINNIMLDLGYDEETARIAAEEYIQSLQSKKKQ